MRVNFKNDLPEGEGALTTVEGDKYEGSFKAGKPNGTGIYTATDGEIAKGHFVNGEPDGKNYIYLKRWGIKRRNVEKRKNDQLMKILSRNTILTIALVIFGAIFQSNLQGPGIGQGFWRGFRRCCARVLSWRPRWGTDRCYNRRCSRPCPGSQGEKADGRAAKSVCQTAGRTREITERATTSRDGTA